MKGITYGLRGKEISLVLIVLTCTTILIWAWDRTPLLATFLPPKNRLLQLPQGTLLGSPPTRTMPHASETHVKEEITTFAENQSVNRQQGPNNIAASEGPVSVLSPTQKTGKSGLLFSIIVCKYLMNSSQNVRVIKLQARALQKQDIPFP